MLLPVQWGLIMRLKFCVNIFTRKDKEDEKK